MPSHLPKSWEAVDGGDQLMRWLPDATNDFFARLQWERKSYEESNHAPHAVLNGDQSRDFMEIEVPPGMSVRLSADGSSDPDGDDLSFKWWQYGMADTYDGMVLLSDSTGIDVSFDLPSDLGDEDIHVILEVVDDGEPTLKSYRRAIIRSSIK